MPVVPPFFQPVIHAIPRTVWSGIQAIVGFDKNLHVDLGFMPMIVRNDCGGTSTKNLLHWAQNMRSGSWRQFDYGEEKNMEVYGQKKPLEYNLESLKTRLSNVPMMLFVGNNDVLVDLRDFQYLKDVLTKDTTMIKFIEDYNHLDYMWAVDANDYINSEILSFFENHAPSLFIQ